MVRTQSSRSSRSERCVCSNSEYYVVYFSPCSLAVNLKIKLFVRYRFTLVFPNHVSLVNIMK